MELRDQFELQCLDCGECLTVAYNKVVLCPSCGGHDLRVVQCIAKELPQAA